MVLLVDASQHKKGTSILRTLFPIHSIIVEPLVTEERIKGLNSSTRSSIFNVYLALSPLCGIAGLSIAATSLHTANDVKTFQTSHFTTDLERTFNSTVYAIAKSEASVACSAAECVKGQTSIPGQCVTVADSYYMWVTRLAENCSPYAYAQENCTGTQGNLGHISAPDCVYAAGAAELDGAGGDIFKTLPAIVYLMVLCRSI